MLIKNETSRVVSFKSEHCSGEIAIGDSVRVSDEQILEDDTFEFSFFSLKKEKRASELKAERGIKGLDIWVETESNLPLITKTSVKGCESLTLCERENTFFLMYWRFRITNLKSVAVTADGKRQKSSYAFCHLADKRCFLRRMTVEGSLALLISILIGWNVWGASFSDAWIAMGIGAGFLASAVRKLIYLFWAMGRDVQESPIKKMKTEHQLTFEE